MPIIFIIIVLSLVYLIFQIITRHLSNIFQFLYIQIFCRSYTSLGLYLFSSISRIIYFDNYHSLIAHIKFIPNITSSSLSEYTEIIALLPE